MDMDANPSFNELMISLFRKILEMADVRNLIGRRDRTTRPKHLTVPI
jgi:hypothetical protein